ncbi:hypothetical protein [Nodosilinea sp. LEGE 06152]|uniref:hypothetical protein n=1 Tax=Nodosilinea sp. LEGE 06152 TaxID=2777966 RepID=UPI00188123FF|nr:hypothetical protein [Nodosilinea sp. LEGE 06152]
MKSMHVDGECEQLSFFNFPADSSPIRKKPLRTPHPLVKAKHKRPEAVYTYQLASDIPTVPVHRVTTGWVAALLGRNARSFRRGISFKAEGFHGQTLLVVWAGVNPENRTEYLWDIHVELAS